MTEQEKRLHRCCFSGHRPEKLNNPEADIKQWLSVQIDNAIAAGYTTFISGCAMGVDIWAGQIVLQKKVQNPALHLIAATPWPGFSNKWSVEWQVQYSELLKNADLIVPVCNHYHKGVFQQRNEWMVDHSNRVIAYFNGAPGSAGLVRGVQTDRAQLQDQDAEPRSRQRRGLHRRHQAYPSERTFPRSEGHP